MTEQERIEAMASKMVFWSCAAAMAPEAMLESCAAQNLKKLMDDIEQLRADHPAQGEAAAAEPALPSWTCFHCGETFTSELDARNHFGSHEGRMTACEIREAGEFAILRALRNVEDQLDRYRAEDSDVLLAMASMQADHAQALRREEEIGYERGLRDAKLPVDLVTPPPARASA